MTMPIGAMRNVRLEIRGEVQDAHFDSERESEEFVRMSESLMAPLRSALLGDADDPVVRGVMRLASVMVLQAYLAGRRWGEIP